MSSEMIERVAAAMHNKKPGGSIMLPFQFQPDAEVFRVYARAAIEAMREPTKQMEKAGWEMDPGDSDGNTDAKTHWRAMIDAALKEPEKG